MAESNATLDDARSVGTWSRWLIAGLLLLVAYVLSVGPAFVWYWCCRLYNYKWAADAYHMFYSPLYAVAHSSPACEQLYENYVNLWLRLGSSR
ncbi:MAG: hypothetical protein JWN70_4475 [Planctomycetaceae bacterium]|nr:hypothetical protein [Planctomycetaceae bacterium]